MTTGWRWPDDCSECGHRPAAGPSFGPAERVLPPALAAHPRPTRIRVAGGDRGPAGRRRRPGSAVDDRLARGRPAGRRSRRRRPSPGCR
ncbi:hypothetical protein ACFFX0_10675 [Citricoccus parietis]|uniref:Uncharacterized protein n=1 Tax=Citricoccus parietis TaxID=592307 RepID=A0ABV5FY77_9MICC